MTEPVRTRRLGALVAALVAALVLLAACARSTSPSASRETNWLTRCVENADCEDTDCVCGLCSRECSDDDPCGADLRCQAVDTVLVSGACGAAPEVLGMCAPECTAEDDCSAEQDCVQGACAPRQLLDAAVPGDGSVVGAGTDSGP